MAGDGRRDIAKKWRGLGVCSLMQDYLQSLLNTAWSTEQAFLQKISSGMRARRLPQWSPTRLLWRSTHHGSAGGRLAAMLASDQGTAARAAALLWSPSDLTLSHSEMTPAGADILRRCLAAARSSSAEFSPALRIERSGACRDWLLIHGDDDELVPVAQSRRMHARLLALGARSTYLELSGQAHFPRSPAAQRCAALRRR